MQRAERKAEVKSQQNNPWKPLNVAVGGKMSLLENSGEAKRREKSDFSVSSIIGLTDASKRTSMDERDSIGKKTVFDLRLYLKRSRCIPGG